MPPGKMDTILKALYFRFVLEDKHNKAWCNMCKAQ